MRNMTRLSVNVNKVALIRNSRSGETPDVVTIARLALDAGAHGITVHPRPDERHIRPYDVEHIAALIRQPVYRDREFNIEGNPLIGQYLAIVSRVKPDQCTLVPDQPGQATSDHGWDLSGDVSELIEIINQLHELNLRVSLFMNPDVRAIELVPRTGADRIELYTEMYAAAFRDHPDRLAEVAAGYAEAAAFARSLGLGVNAGHDLNIENLGRFLEIQGIDEVSIGHALIADAIEWGITRTVKSYLDVIAKGS